MSDKQVDIDQTLLSVMSDLGLHCLLIKACLSQAKYGNYHLLLIFLKKKYGIFIPQYLRMVADLSKKKIWHFYSTIPEDGCI